MSLRPFTPDSGRQSPFKRQNSSASTSTGRATTPTPASPSKFSNTSPTKTSSLSPEKPSPFGRRPSQNSQTAARPSSPFGRPSSSLSITTSPSRPSSYISGREESSGLSPRTASISPAPEESGYPSPFDGPALDSPSIPAPSPTTFRSSMTTTPHRSERALSNTSTIKAPSFATKPASTAPRLGNGTSGYNHVPQALLRSMRESFEVLDSSNTGSISSASVASMLEQMGLPNALADVREFFPQNGPAQLNLARYLDTLSSPFSDLSQAHELAAAFSAFDVDDSGQIDVAQLRTALLNTAPEPGEQMVKLNEKEIDGILGEFTGRRAFGAKGMHAAKGKDEVFRWREFMGTISGGGGTETPERASVAY